MSSVTLDIASAVTLTSGCAVALAFTALRAGVLRLRPEPRRCPSCGRRLRSWACAGCTRRRVG
jgi:hypothetical protein